MANFTVSPNMNLVIPSVGEDPGPDWAQNLDSSLTLIDQHDHSAGNGVRITPSGLNINSDLSFSNNNLTTARSLRLSSQNAALSGSLDLGCLYEVANDLYFNDGLGNQVRITQSGGVAGSPGSIANLASPASASYVSANSTFVWQSAANTPANMDAAAYIFRNLSASSFGLTLSPPAALAANYTITLPTLPGSGTKIMQIDSTGAQSAVLGVDSTTISIATNNLQVSDLGISTAKIAAKAVTAAKIADNTITASQIVNGTITGTQIATDVNLLGKAATVGSQNIVVANTNLTNGLALVRGRVGSLGNLTDGEGCTPSRLGVGLYQVLYATPFSGGNSAVVTVSAFDGSGAAFLALTITGETENGFTVQIRNSATGTGTDASFTFIAVGERA